MPVTARDFVFTLRARIARKDELEPEERAVVEQVRSVSAVGAKTVRVVLRGRHAGWRDLFGNILPRHALAGRSSEASGPTESSTRRRAGRSGAGPSSPGGGSAASS